MNTSRISTSFFRLAFLLLGVSTHAGAEMPPTSARTVDAATQLDNGNAYFFLGDRYVRYDIAKGSLAGTEPQPILGNFSKNWPAGWTSVDAAVNLGNGGVYFFRGSQYARYDIKQARIQSNYPLQILGNFSKNWPAGWNSVDAAVNLGNGGVYFFRGTQYARYDIAQGRIMDGYPLPIAGNFAGSWPSGWPSVHAAVNWGNGNAYFFRDEQYGRYEIKTARVAGPQSILGNFSKNWLTSLTEHQKSRAVTDLARRVSEIQPSGNLVDIPGTCSNHVLTTYSAITEHLQGIARLENGTWVLSHSTARGKRPMLVTHTPGGRTSIHLIESSTRFPHVGSIQACGNLVVMPVEPYYDGSEHDGPDSEVRFVDLDNPSQPKLLSTVIKRQPQRAGAAGMAWHEAHGCHYVVVQDGGTTDLYQSNGHPIGHPSCAFRHVKAFSVGSQGGTQLLYEHPGNLYLVLFAKKGERETMTLHRIDDPADGSSASVEKVVSKDLGPAQLSVVQREPSFRWGGTIVPIGNDLEVYAASRLLCYAPVVEDKTVVKRWSDKKVFTFKHNGGYVANFVVTYSVNGKAQSWNSGDMTAGFSKVLTLPGNAQDVRCHAKAAVFIKTWRDIYKGPIDPGIYEAHGTTLDRKWRKL